MLAIVACFGRKRISRVTYVSIFAISILKTLPVNKHHDKKEAWV